MPVKVDIESLGHSTSGESFRVTARWRHKGSTGDAQFLAWSDLPETWIQGFRDLADVLTATCTEPQTARDVVNDMMARLESPIE